jgi:hypothetical protein
VEQIRLAEEVKITKDKIKEVEEEWQNNLLNWKSKRRQSRGTCNVTSTRAQLEPENDEVNSNRKIKTFSEILNEKAKSGYRIGYNLHKYIRNGSEDDDDEREGEGDEDDGDDEEDDETSEEREEPLRHSSHPVLTRQTGQQQQQPTTTTTSSTTTTTTTG